MLSRLGCTAVVQSPRELRDPMPAFLLDHGRTSSLVIPDEAGGLIRYGYGDWSYYALRHMGFFNAVAALFWPTPAALGRYPFSGPASAENVRRQLHVEIKHVYTLHAERAAVERLRRRLEQIYWRNIKHLVWTESVEFAFVPHPEPYTLLHNSNHVVADWLAALGIRVKGSPMYSSWRIETPKPR